MQTQSRKGGFKPQHHESAETSKLFELRDRTLLAESLCLYSGSWPHSVFLVAMSGALSSTESYSLLSLSLAAVGVLLNTFTGEGEPLIASIAFSCLAFASCYALIRWLGNAFIKRGFKGKDLCKLKQTEMYYPLLPFRRQL